MNHVPVIQYKVTRVLCPVFNEMTRYLMFFLLAKLKNVLYCADRSSRPYISPLQDIEKYPFTFVLNLASDKILSWK